MPSHGFNTWALALAQSIQRILTRLILTDGYSAEIQWVKGHAGIPGNGKADALADKAAEKTA